MDDLEKGALTSFPATGNAYQRVQELERRHQQDWNKLYPEKEAGALAASHADENRALAYELARELDLLAPSTAAVGSDLPRKVEGASYFRKKAVVVSALQWFKWGDHPAVNRFKGNPRYADVDKSVGRPWIYTLEGGHFVTPGDWIIEGVEGEFYPCKPEIFAKTYEPLHVAPSSTRGIDQQGIELLKEALDFAEVHSFMLTWQNKVTAYLHELPSTSTGAK